MRRLIILLALLFSFSVQAQQSTFVDKFATGTTIATATTHNTKWYVIDKHVYVDFTVEASAGDGSLEVQYATERFGTGGVISDANTATFDTTAPTSLIGSGMSKHYIRLAITCTTAPCTYSAWLLTKGFR
jgi:hypothetical protein